MQIYANFRLVFPDRVAVRSSILWETFMNLIDCVIAFWATRVYCRQVDRLIYFLKKWKIVKSEAVNLMNQGWRRVIWRSHLIGWQILTSSNKVKGPISWSSLQTRGQCKEADWIEWNVSWSRYSQGQTVIIMSMRICFDSINRCILPPSCFHQSKRYFKLNSLRNTNCRYLIGCHHTDITFLHHLLRDNRHCGSRWRTYRISTINVFILREQSQKTGPRK